MKSTPAPPPTDAELDEARRRYEARLAIEPLATRVYYDRVGDTIVVEMNNGAALVVPRRLMQGLTNAIPEQLERAQLCGDGTFIDFDELDTQFTVMSLLMGIYGGKKWMSEVASRAGATRSPAKAAAARANGRKGGRPRKSAAERP